MSMQMFIAALLIIALNWKQPKCPSVRDCISRLVDLYYGMLFSNKKEPTVDTPVTWMSIIGLMTVS